mgnify:CR=1 FL=1
MDSKEILLYWFGNENKFNSKKWFIESYKYDKEIKERFEKMLLIYETKKGFEHLNFKDGLDKAQSIFGGKVYMDPEYYIGLYNEGKIKTEQLEKNLLKLLKESNLEKAKKFMLETSPIWNGLRSYEELKVHEIDEVLHTYLEENSIYMNTDAWIESLTEHMTLYEIHDAIFAFS